MCHGGVLLLLLRCEAGQTKTIQPAFVNMLVRWEFKNRAVSGLHVHHARTLTGWEAPIFCGHSKVNHSVPGVNVQNRTLQDRRAVMSPLDTDIRSLFASFFFFFLKEAKEEADLKSVP